MGMGRLIGAGETAADGREFSTDGAEDAGSAFDFGCVGSGLIGRRAVVISLVFF
jgi:hypothetical protein